MAADREGAPGLKAPVPALSVAIPVYNEAEFLRANLLTIKDWVEKTGLSYELLVVDDGSRDGTWGVIEELSRQLPQLRAWSFTRNFGKESAILCALQAARGQAAIVTDCDLQHPPELIPQMVAAWRREGAPAGVDVVEARKAGRGRESLFRRWSAALYYGLMRALSGADLRNASDYKLLSRRALDAYLRMPEANRFFRGMVQWLGFAGETLRFQVPAGAARRSRWSASGLARLSLDSILAFSHLPLRLVTLLSFAALALSLLLTAHTLYMKLSGRAVAGFATVIIVTLFIGGCVMFSLGIIGEYLARIYDELKRRPAYLVRASLEPPG